MGWTQTSTLHWAVLCPIAHLPCQPFSLHSLRIFCSLCAHRTSWLELEEMAVPWLSDIPSHAGSALARAPVPCRTLCTTLCGFSAAPFGKPSYQLRLGQSLYSFLSQYNKCLDNQHSSASSQLKTTSLYLKTTSLYWEALRSGSKGSDRFWEVIRPFLKLIKNLLQKGSCSSLRNHLRTVTERHLNVNNVLFRLVSEGGREDVEMERGVQLGKTTSWAFGC